MSGRSWKFESSHGHEKQKSANSRFFFALPLPFSCFCFPHTTLSCPSLSSKSHDNIDNKDNISYLIPKSYCPRLSLVVVKKYDNTNNKDNISFLFQKCCPRLSLVVVKKTRQHKQQRQHFYFQKCCPKLSLVVVKKSHDNIDNKDNISISKNVVQSCPSLSSKKSSFHENIYLCLRKY